MNFIANIYIFILNENARKYRRINIGIRGVNFLLTPPSDIEDELNDLCDWYKSSINQIHPIELTSTFHHRFEQIHPFIDGNGRVIRELINSWFIDMGLPYITLPNSRNVSYHKSLRQTDNGDYNDIINLFNSLLLEKMLVNYF